MLINCAAYQDGSKLSDIPVSEISDYVNRPDCFVWVALRNPDHDEIVQMQEEFDLHELAVEDAQHGHQRPKIEEYADSLFAVMHTVELEADDTLLVGEIDVFVGRNYVLSIRNRSRQNFLGVRARCEREPELLKLGSGFVLYALMDAVVDQYFPIIQEFETRLEIIEGQIFGKGAARNNIRLLYELKQHVMVVKHAAAPLMDEVAKLASGRPPKICEGTQNYFRDVYDHLSRINTSIDSIRDTIATAIQVNLAMVTIEESEVSKRLAAWAGIFAVATAFAGIWGMNFKHMPELEWRYGYPAALSLITGICFVLYRRFKRAGWL
ncbi:MAG TPA: magnesium/cobalt transporter CorA [Rhodocyclaceae bacterium]|jgi:magnesium transporter|nr:magnesium/cobalt transporter CorA [Rhodocyclaceae bacterium]